MSDKKTAHTFKCRESLWAKFEQMAKELECSADYLINDAMKQYARQRGYGSGGRTTGANPASSGPEAPTVAPARARTSSASGPPPAPPPAAGPPRTTLGGPSARPPGLPPRNAPAPGLGRPPGPPPPPAAARQVNPMAVTTQMPARPPMMPAAPPRPGARGPGAPPPPGMAAGPPPLGARAAPPAPTGQRRPIFVYYMGQRHSVDKDRFIIGRGKQSSDLVIRDPNVSRQHAMVEYLNGQYYIVDMGSTNGIEYSGQRIQRRAVQDGDQYRVCDHELRFAFQ